MSKPTVLAKVHLPTSNVWVQVVQLAPGLVRLDVSDEDGWAAAVMDAEEAKPIVTALARGIRE